jgi:GntR family transcriptional regulator
VRRQGKGTFVTQHDGSRLMFHFFHIVGRDGSKEYPTVRTLAFGRARATAAEAAALGIAPHDKVIRVRNLLSLAGRPSIVDDITLPAQLVPGLTEKLFVARNNTIYHLYQSRAPLLEIRRVALTFRDRPVELRLSRVDTARLDYHNTLGKGVPV